MSAACTRSHPLGPNLATSGAPHGRVVFHPNQSLGCFADEASNRALQLYTAETCNTGDTYMSPLVRLRSSPR